MGYEQTLKEVLENPAGQTPITNLDGTLSQASETKTGDTPKPVYVSGIDISDVPEQDRTRISELLTKKAKLLEDGYQPKFQEVSKLKKAQEDLIKMGLSVDEARDVLVKHIEQKKNPVTTTTQKKDAVKTLDKLIENSPYEQREALQQMRQIIVEETDIGDLKKQIGELQNLVGMLSGKYQVERSSQVDTDLNKLAETYGNEIVDKYREQVKEIAGRFPNEPIRKIFFHEAADELEESLLLKKTEKTSNNTQTKKQAISSQGSGITSATEGIDIKKESFSSLLNKVKTLGR